MRDIIVVAAILAGLAVVTYHSFRRWQRYRDFREVRALIGDFGLFLAAIALGVATWALSNDDDLVQTVSLLVGFGKGVLLAVTAFLLYFDLREGRATV